MKAKMFDYPHYVEATLADRDKLWVSLMWAITTVALVAAVLYH